MAGAAADDGDGAEAPKACLKGEKTWRPEYKRPQWPSIKIHGEARKRAYRHCNLYNASRRTLVVRILQRRDSSEHVVGIKRRTEVCGGGGIKRNLRDVDELHEPPSAGLPTGRSRRVELVGEVEGEAIGRWWRSVSEGPRLRRLTHGPRLHALQAALLGAPARAMDMLYLRPVCAGGVSDLVSAPRVDPSLPHAVV